MPREPALPAHMRTAEYWLSRGGVGLLLLGLIFLFKYAIDEGWLTPSIRVAFGILLGAGLIGFGLRVRSRRPQFSPLLLGAGIASWYISGFAAYQLFGLVGYPLALGFMVLVTLVAWVLSVRENQAVLSIIGLVGGLATPFLLYTGSGSMSGLMTYVCLIVTGVALLFLFRGWRTLITTAATGSWLVLYAAYYKGVENAPGSDDALWPLQMGILVVSFLLWLVPLTREILSTGNPDRWPPPERQPDPVLAGLERELAPRSHAHLLSIATPIYALMLSYQLWDLPDRTWGWIVLTVASLYALAALVFRPRDELRQLAFTHATMALGLFTVSLNLILNGNSLLAVWAVEVAVLHAVALRTGWLRLRVGGHILAVIVCGWLAARLAFESTSGVPLFNADALANLLAVSAGFISAYFLTRIRDQRIYIIASYLVLAGLFARELDGNVLMLVLMLQAVLFRLLITPSSDSRLSMAANLFFLVPGLLLAERLQLNDVESLLEPSRLRPVLNASAITDLMVIVAAGYLMRIERKADVRLVFLLCAHVAVLIWFLREFAGQSNGQAYVSMAWGIYAITLLVIGLRNNSHRLRQASLVTLLVVVAKLFLVDLSALEAIWRVLLFMGFGALFLLLSYNFRRLWQAPQPPLNHQQQSDKS